MANSKNHPEGYWPDKWVKIQAILADGHERTLNELLHLTDISQADSRYVGRWLTDEINCGRIQRDQPGPNKMVRYWVED